MLEEAQKKYLELRKLVSELQREQNKRLEGIRLELAKNCSHPVEAVEPYRWEHDNGYGRQKMLDGLRCTICHFINHWKGSSPSSWTDPKHISYD